MWRPPVEVLGIYYSKMDPTIKYWSENIHESDKILVTDYQNTPKTITKILPEIIQPECRM